ncbi:MAG: T9SS type A sorting domain-containing protein [Bacteroidota bacterium]
MKPYYLLTLLFFLSLAVQAQIVNIPDPIFKDALVNNPVVDTNDDGVGDTDVDTNNDGEVQLSEALAVTALYVNDFGINDMQGSEAFDNVVILDCSDNNLQIVDVTEMSNLEVLDFSSNFFAFVDVTQNPGLRELIGRSNDMTQLNLTQNVNLELLDVGGNEFASLNVTQNPNLVYLDCAVNELTNLDVSQNPNLESLEVSVNPLTSLDVSANPALDFLEANNCNLTTIDVTQNPALNTLFMGFNDLTGTIDFSQNIDLETVVLFENLLTHLDFSLNPNLEVAFLRDNELTSLNIKNGNSGIITFISTLNNPDLQCILVDDEDYANSQMCIDPIGEGWCKDATTTYSEDCILGVDDNALVAFSLSPNPAKQQIRIQSSEAIDEIEVYTTAGALVIEESNRREVDVSSLPSGIYLARIFTTTEVVSKQFIKE